MSDDSTGSGVRAAFRRFAGAMAYVAVKNADDEEGIGSAFHVGEGVFVTARHVVEGKRILKIASFASTRVRLEGDVAKAALVTIREGDGEYKANTVRPAEFVIKAGPFYHPNADVDVAVFQVAEIDPYTPVVPLGDHLDDWLGEDDFVLTDVLLLGFPPVPLAHGPHLVAALGQVNAMVDLRHAKHVHFIVSATPRGGFSGGLVVTAGGVALGVITQSLVMDNLPEQLGYMTVLSVEPIFVCLAEHRLLPAIQAEGWDDFWNAHSITFVEHSADGLGGETRLAEIEWVDDGRNLRIDVLCPREVDRDAALAITIAMLGQFRPKQSLIERDRVRIVIERKEGSSEALVLAAQAAAEKLDRAGYVRSKTVRVR